MRKKSDYEENSDEDILKKIQTKKICDEQNSDKKKLNIQYLSGFSVSWSIINFPGVEFFYF